MTTWIIHSSESWLWGWEWRKKAAAGGYREAVVFVPCYVPPVLLQMMDEMRCCTLQDFSTIDEMNATCELGKGVQDGTL